MREQAILKQNDCAVGELLPAQTDVPRCFGCGLDNPSGLKLRFTKEDEKTVSTQFTAPYDWTGWGNILHGGFHGLLHDEITAWVPFALLNERNFVTKEMTITYLKPAYVEQPLYVVGQLLEDQYNTPQKLDRAIRWVIVCHNREGERIWQKKCGRVTMRPLKPKLPWKQ